jgi:O-antigen/teichoic acid export membrane protein
MALIQYIFPKIYRMLSTGEANGAQIKKQFFLYFGVLTAGLIGLLITMPLVYTFFVNEKYHAALEYSYLLCIGIYIWCISYFFYSFLLYYKEKRKLLGLSVMAIIVSLICNYFFIREWQVWGAAVSSCVLYAIVFIVTMIFTRHHWLPIFRNNAIKKSTDQL